MRFLVLTNDQENFDFIYDCIRKVDVSRDDFRVKYNGKYEWNDDYFPDYDIGISFMYQYRVPKEQLAKPWFNFHPAPLPEYKGRNLCYHAIMNGETEFGASLHYMDENFDTGDIIEVWKFPIGNWFTAENLSSDAIAASKMLFERYFPRIIAGEQFERLPNVGGTYYKKEEIDDSLYLTEWNKRRIRAITYGDFYPKVEIGGVTYKIVRDE